jgi:hypothetical protein
MIPTYVSEGRSSLFSLLIKILIPIFSKNTFTDTPMSVLSVFQASHTPVELIIKLITTKFSWLCRKEITGLVSEGNESGGFK